MVILSIAVAADLGFIIAHHLMRIFVVILGAPIAARWIRLPSSRKPPGPPDPPD